MKGSFNMRYFTNINNVKCLEWGLNANQGALFDLLNQASSWADTYIIDNEVFYHVSRNLVLEELPLFFTKSDTVYRNFIDLQEKGLIEYKKVGKKDVIKLTEKGKCWNAKLGNESEKNAKLGNKSEKTRNEIRKNSDSNPTNNNINNNNIKDNSSSKEKPNDYRRHSQNENIRTKEVEQAWKECGLAEYKYTPVENMNIAIKTFGLVEVVKAIQRISKSSLMKTKTNIDSFFNKNNDFEQIRKTLNSSYDDREKKTETITATGNINMRYFQ
mgnify:CR=1 FL=1